MDSLISHLILLQGFLIFSACSPYQYIMISNIMTWYDAQNYCRTKYIDLATIENLDDDNTIFSLATNQGYTGWFWIGLYNDINSWRWSLNDSNFYTQSNVQYRNWGSGQPDNYQGHQACARMLSDGSWDDLNCEEVIPFICYGEASGFIFISEAKSWTEAQSFCRQNYKDLASVRNDAENQQIQILIPTGGDAWIGLFRDTWKWSDKSSLSFTFWAPGEPNNYLGGSENCGQIYIYNGSPGNWNDLNCTSLLPFFCYADSTTPSSSTLNTTTDLPAKSQEPDSTTPSPSTLITTTDVPAKSQEPDSTTPSPSTLITTTDLLAESQEPDSTIPSASTLITTTDLPAESQDSTTPSSSTLITTTDLLAESQDSTTPSPSTLITTTDLPAESQDSTTPSSSTLITTTDLLSESQDSTTPSPSTLITTTDLPVKFSVSAGGTLTMEEVKVQQYSTMTVVSAQARQAVLGGLDTLYLALLECLSFRPII